MLYRYTSSPNHVRLGGHLWNANPFDPSYNRLGYELGLYENVSHEIDLPALLGRGASPDLPVLTYNGLEPSPNSTPAQRRVHEIETFFSNASHILDFDFRRNLNDEVRGEHSIYHTNIVGVVKDGQFLRDPFNYPQYHDPRYAGVMFTTGQTFEPTYLISYSGTSSKGYFAQRLPQLQAEVQAGDWNYTAGGVDYFHHSLEFRADEYTVDEVSYQWGYIYYDGGSQIYTRRTWKILLRYSFPLTQYIALDGQQVPNSYFSWYVMTYFYTVDPLIVSWALGDPEPPRVGNPGHVSFWADFQDYTYLSSLGSLTGFEQGVGLHSDGSASVPMVTHNPGNLLCFEKQVQAVEKDLYVGNYFSFSEAVKSGMSGLESNNLENLAQIQGLLAVIPATIDLYGLVRGISKGDFSLKRLLDFLVNVNLMMKFGYAPTLGDAEEIVRKAKPLRDALFGEPHVVTSYGRWGISVPTSMLPFEGAYLYAGSKVRFGINSDMYLPYFLNADRLGLLPTLSRVWAIIPFSFVIDYFFNIERKLDIVDNFFRYMVLDLKYVTHSLRLDWEFTSEFMDEFSFSRGLSGKPTGYRTFIRYVSNVPPMVTPSRLPIFEPRIPSWDTVGSLVYTFLR